MNNAFLQGKIQTILYLPTKTHFNKCLVPAYLYDDSLWGSEFYILTLAT